MIKKLFLLTIGLLSISVFNGCATIPNLTSQFSNGITIDGSQADWQGALKQIEKEGIAFGIKNNKDKLYFCMVTTDKQKVMKILRSGLTVWFNPNNDLGEYLGIKFPTGKGPEVMRNNKPEEFNNPENENIENMIKEMIVKQSDYVIVNNDNFPLNTYQINSKDNVKLKLNYINYQFVYEGEIDLKSFNLSSVAEVLSVGFITDKIDMPERKERTGFDDDEDSPTNSDFGQGGGRGTGKRGGGGMMRERNQDSFKQLEYWFNVTLAK